METAIQQYLDAAFRDRIFRLQTQKDAIAKEIAYLKRRQRNKRYRQKIKGYYRPRSETVNGYPSITTHLPGKLSQPETEEVSTSGPSE